MSDETPFSIAAFKATFLSGLNEGDQNSQDNHIHKALEGSAYSLGVWMETDGRRRYEVATPPDYDNPHLVTHDRVAVWEWMSHRIPVTPNIKHWKPIS